MNFNKVSKIRIFYLFGFLLFFLFISCDDSTTEATECNPKCEEWQECDDSTNSCKLKRGMCDKNTDCEELICEDHKCLEREKKCDDGTEIKCNTIKPTCKDGMIPAIIKECWECVDSVSCKPIVVRDDSCDDGTEITCKMMEPTCEDYEILSHQNSCYKCVNKLTCEPWGEPNCKKDSDCKDNEYCNPCGTSDYNADNCILACTTHKCDTEDSASCEVERPECGKDNFAVVKDSCWECVDSVSCKPIVVRDDSCDDGTEVTCKMAEPTCEDYEILSYQNSCYKCVNKLTCEPWGEPNCEKDSDCKDNEYCNPCGTSGYNLDNCVLACTTHNCPTEDIATCEMVRPKCKEGEFAVVENSCWKCVNPETCNDVECNVAKDCVDKFWNKRCVGHWSCIDNTCDETCDNINCGDGACDIDLGESETSCSADCSVECHTTADCLDNSWESNGSGHWTCHEESGFCIEIVESTTCGDRTCDRDGGETSESCPVDCATGGECIRASDCADNDWIIDGQGHWSCDRGNCEMVVDSDDCGDSICNYQGGETADSCITDCASFECLTAEDCLDKEWTIYCNGSWSCESGSCVPLCEDTVDSTCGDGHCDLYDTETCDICSTDCNDYFLCQ